jgi:hypothetical protein
MGCTCKNVVLSIDALNCPVESAAYFVITVHKFLEIILCSVDRASRYNSDK